MRIIFHILVEGLGKPLIIIKKEISTIFRNGMRRKIGNETRGLP